MEEVNSTLMDDLEGFKPSVEEITADVVNTAREPDSEVEHEELTELLQSHDNTLTDDQLLLMEEQTQWFPEMKSTLGEDALKTVEMTTKT